MAISSFSIHVRLSRVQATTGGPLGAAVGIMIFGPAEHRGASEPSDEQAGATPTV